jgi:hypothetical protein
VRNIQPAKIRTVQAEKTTSAARQPPQAAAIGTARADESVEPT